MILLVSWEYPSVPPHCCRICWWCCWKSLTCQKRIVFSRNQCYFSSGVSLSSQYTNYLTVSIPTYVIYQYITVIPIYCHPNIPIYIVIAYQHLPSKRLHLPSHEVLLVVVDDKDVVVNVFLGPKNFKGRLTKAR